MKKINNIDKLQNDDIKIPWQGMFMANLVLLLGFGFVVWSIFLVFFIIAVAEWGGSSVTLVELVGMMLLCGFIDFIVGFIILFVYDLIIGGSKLMLIFFFIGSIVWLFFPLWILVDVGEMNFESFITVSIIGSIFLIIMVFKGYKKLNFNMGFLYTFLLITMMASGNITDDPEYHIMSIILMLTSILPFYLFFKCWEHPFYKNFYKRKNIHIQDGKLREW